jgi:hypothetical protein
VDVIARLDGYLDDLHHLQVGSVTSNAIPCLETHGIGLGILKTLNYTKGIFWERGVSSIPALRCTWAQIGAKTRANRKNCNSVPTGSAETPDITALRTDGGD